ncbi:helix-turn-helix domain-containing protein [Bacillus timonensis]|uniref:Helix-turn-helix domain-containing protein n=1 Tax=Bacillus timonensis TaxID=1033734 RepID=A0A4S3PW56_9BACI|nr:helix-turn-helix domain-containing protein [Bacillus timonensis]THE13958.1 helix-turn-helix domain-containing protein [Bacillus timonensis]
MDKKLQENSVELACKLINETTNIPIYVLDRHRKIKLDYSSNLPYNPIFTSNQEQLQSIELFETTKLFPRLHKNEFLEQYVSIPFVQHNTYLGTILLGPTVFPKPSEIFLDETITFHELGEMATEIKNYYYSLPVISSWKLLHASVLLSNVIFSKKFDINEVLHQNQINIEAPLNVELPDKNISLLLQNAFYHHDPVSEGKLYQYITDGNKEDILLYYKAFRQRSDFEFGKLSKKSELRSQKNLTIATITLATRAAIAGGLHSEIAYTLGDRYIQDLEELHSIKDIETFTENVLYEFADRVNQNKKQLYSKPISDCHKYIFKHIYENLSLSILADYVSLNPKYLSNIFKKEVGMTISEYIQRSKIEEAIKLMTFSDYSLSEIYSLLNFTDQSYFTKVFKKFIGLTPKQYMNKINEADNLFRSNPIQQSLIHN